MQRDGSPQAEVLGLEGGDLLAERLPSSAPTALSPVRTSAGAPCRAGAWHCFNFAFSSSRAVRRDFSCSTAPASRQCHWEAHSQRSSWAHFQKYNQMLGRGYYAMMKHMSAAGSLNALK